MEGSFALIKKLCWGGGGTGVQGPFKTFSEIHPFWRVRASQRWHIVIERCLGLAEKKE